jgi:hypothetical protein
MLKDQLKVISCLTVITSLTLLIPTSGFSDYGAAQNSLSTDSGLAGISHVRRTLRGACDKLKAIDGKAEYRSVLLQESAAESRQALLLWQEFRKSHSENAPPVYNQNPDWSRSADEIEQTIQQMISANLDGDSKKAFTSCGQTCRNFIAMNEKAGIELTNDILFQFRKDAKLLMPAIQENDSAKIDAVVKALLNLKDRALVNPVDGTGAPVKNQQALQTFSETVSALAASIQSADRNMLSDRYSKMMSAMETAYDLYL